MNATAMSVLVAIVGGSGAGKSWLAEKLRSALGRDAARLSLDDFYLDRSHLSPRRRARTNFDHPRAIDWPAFRRVIQDFLAGRAARVPGYDFATHCRLGRFRVLKPKPILLIDGLWLLRPAWLRRLFSLRVFLDCPTQTRLRRRLERDLKTRGRSRTSVKQQFRKMAEPMHQKYVGSQAKWADVVLAKPCGSRELKPLVNAIKELRNSPNGGSPR
jgi:uridine kinase